MSRIVQAFLNLIFPPMCLACDGVLLYNESDLCSDCLVSLPPFDLSIDVQRQSLLDKFYGLIPFRNFFTMYYFSKKGRVQQLLHKLKYSYQPEAIIRLGHFLATNFDLGDYEGIDIIVPVPLYKRRHRVRGYNQSALLAAGISQVIDKPVVTDILIRDVPTKTQTGKSRQERWDSMHDVFTLNPLSKAIIKGKDILLVDDLVTTGATLAACAQVLLKRGVASLSMATLAVANKE